MAENRQYDHEYKVEAVNLAKEIGQAKAAKELGILKNTMYGWQNASQIYREAACRYGIQQSIAQEEDATAMPAGEACGPE